MKKQKKFILFSERHIMLLIAIICLPLLIPLIPFMLFFRFATPKRGVKIGLVVSNKWPDYLQYARFPYDLALFRAGAAVITISPNKIDSVNELLDQVDGVLFTGGEDLGEDEKYDDLGFAILKKAEIRKLPILGVCRGMQLIAIAHGGKLTTHESDSEQFFRHKASSFSIAGHDVNIKPTTKLYEIFGSKQTHVNSLHHQSVESSGDLTVSARSDDGTVEAIESQGDAFLIGVQWHPELRALFSSKNEKVFTTLIDNAVIC